MAWNYRQYGSAIDPVHKSHLNDITGDWGCPTRFRYAMDARAAAGGAVYNLDKPVRGDAACGTAAHETIARVLTHPETRDRVLAGPGVVSRDHVARTLNEELKREAGGRRIEWYDDDAGEVITDRVSMVCGLLDDLHRHVAEVVLVEPAFLVKLGAHWLSGHIDLVYRPRRNPAGLALADWKTGASRPLPIELDHGWEAGVYSLAVHSGVFLDRAQLEVIPGGEAGVTTVACGTHTVTHPSRYMAERECAERVLAAAATAAELKGASPGVPLQSLYRFPGEIYHVHLGDYVPYKRGGKKAIKRPEDLAWYRLAQPATVKFEAGALRGPAWLPVRITEHDIPRVEYRVRNVVGMIRMGRFIDQIGDRCAKCPYAGDCLTGGYALRGDARKDAERALQGTDTSSADDLVID